MKPLSRGFFVFSYENLEDVMEEIEFEFEVFDPSFFNADGTLRGLG